LWNSRDKQASEVAPPSIQSSMPQHRTIAHLLTLVVLATLAAWSAATHAQDERLEPPSRVGRISDIAGELFLAASEHGGEWSPIGLNYPVTAGDNLWISVNGRAEADFGNARLRFASDTNLQVSALGDTELALFMASGRAIVRMRSMAPGELARVETPHTQIDIVRPGAYRIDVDPAGKRTTLSVREGEAAVRFAAGMQQVLSGQVAVVTDIDGAGLAIQNGYSADSFDAWSATREQRYDGARATAYVPADMVGARDLDDYGNWETTPAYGAVWYPSTVAIGWAPYRYGSWTWVAPFGWTWVDSAPWGYAPFHYGRWVYASGRWGWCPGERVGRPRWAPALVAWYGGSGWAGSNVYGWVPLAWGEPYVPSWARCSARCWRQYNQPYAVAQGDAAGATPLVYANALVPGGLTAVPASVLSGARPVAANQVNIGPAAASNAPMLGGPPAFAPSPARSGSRQNFAAPIPAGVQFQLARDARFATPTAMPSPATAGAAASRAPPVAGVPLQRRVPQPTAHAFGNDGVIVAAPPRRPTVSAAPAVAVAPTQVAPVPTYGGVPEGRGAYTGVVPTPGPKAAAPVEHGFVPHWPVTTYVAPAVAPVPVGAVPAAPGRVVSTQGTPVAPAAVVPSRVGPLPAPVTVAPAAPAGGGMVPSR